MFQIHSKGVCISSEISEQSIDLWTARPKWRFVNPAYGNRYHNIIMKRYGFHIIIIIQASDA